MPQLTELDDTTQTPLEEPIVQDGSGSDSEGSLPELEAGGTGTAAEKDIEGGEQSPTSGGKVSWN